MKRYITRPVLRIGDTMEEIPAMDVLGEEPLSIRIQGAPYTVIMRTPGEEIAHVAGFCLGEGLVDEPDDFTSLAYCDEDVNVVTATLRPERRAQVGDLLQRRSYISQTSCGICGKELIGDLTQQLPRAEDGPAINPQLILSCLRDLPACQPLRDRTRASHGAAVHTARGECLETAEDVGRHNALDKAVGKLFLSRRLDKASLLVMSSRISYELVQKAARAKIPVVAGVSRPTSLALSLAESLGMTLVCQDGSSGMFVFCGGLRLKKSNS